VAGFRNISTFVHSATLPLPCQALFSPPCNSSVSGGGPEERRHAGSMGILPMDFHGSRQRRGAASPSVIPLAGMGRQAFGWPSMSAVNSADRTLPPISRSIIDITIDCTHRRSTPAILGSNPIPQMPSIACDKACRRSDLQDLSGRNISPHFTRVPLADKAHVEPRVKPGAVSARESPQQADLFTDGTGRPMERRRRWRTQDSFTVELYYVLNTIVSRTGTDGVGLSR
jgi:hypothetical protein